MLSTGTCKTCGGSGQILVEEINDYVREVYGDKAKPCIFVKPCPECNGGHAQKVIQVRERANIPPSFYDSRLKDFNWDGYLSEDGKKLNLAKQKKFVDHFVENYEAWKEQGLGFYIYSRIRGSGKTFLASCICNELMDNWHMVTKFVSVSNLISMDQEDSTRNFEKKQIDVLCDCEVLVLDDLGQKKTGENWLDDILFRILDYRYQRKKVTIITSNIEIQRINFDDRIADRLNKMCQPLPLPNYSYRQRESNREKNKFFTDMGLM